MAPPVSTFFVGAGGEGGGGGTYILARFARIPAKWVQRRELVYNRFSCTPMDIFF